MHERKAEMARESDAFIALPGIFFKLVPSFFIVYMKIVFMVSVLSGGYGTMEEVLEMITWSHLGIHKKPVSFLFL